MPPDVPVAAVIDAGIIDGIGPHGTAKARKALLRRGRGKTNPKPPTMGKPAERRRSAAFKFADG